MVDGDGPNRFTRARNFWKQVLLFIVYSVKDPIVRFVDFSGRTARTPFLIAFILFGATAITCHAFEIWAIDWSLTEDQDTVIFGFKALRYVLLFLMCSLFVRRVHDLGFSIWAFLNPFDFKRDAHFPLLTIWDLGNPNTNQYGPPHELSLKA